MRKIIFWLDLAFCFLWMVVSLANCFWWSLPIHFLLVITIAMRITLSFSLYRGEKRSWIPLTVFSALFALLTFEGVNMRTIDKFAFLPFDVWGIIIDHSTYRIIKGMMLAWLFLGPLTVYIAGLCRKTLKSSNMSWKEALGAMLWKDRWARLYCQMLVVAIGAWHIGLAMNLRMCVLGCLTLSPLSYCLLVRYIGSKDNNFESMTSVGKVALMIIGMAVFFFAQSYGGVWRVLMLAVSFAIVTYVCWQTFGKQGYSVSSLLAALYLGVMLPTMSIGHNQYACIMYGREDLSVLMPYRGFFLIKDAETGKVGLRDRYGLLVEPEYESISLMPNYYPRCCALKNNGFVKLYYIYRNCIVKPNAIDEDLQKEVCKIAERSLRFNGYATYDRVEVIVTELFNKNDVISHVKMKSIYENTICDYSDEPYIPMDHVSIRSEEFASDTIVIYREAYNVLRYSYDVKRDDVSIYNIDVKVATKNVPAKEDLVELAEDIEKMLNKKSA